MKKFNIREKRWFSITLAVFGLFLVISGAAMNKKLKPIIQKKLTIHVEKRQIATAQAKTNEIKTKDLEIELNTPISVDIKDYLDNMENLDENAIKSLKLDTSLVNINEAGIYQYKIIYKKKSYVGNIKVKEKELPNMTLTLKTIKLNTKDSVSNNPKDYINETLTEEVLENITLDISKVDTTTQGDYTYYITYKKITYQGKIEVRDPAPVIPPKEEEKEPEKEKEQGKEEEQITCPEGSVVSENTCACNDETKTYDEKTKTCK